MDQNNGSYYLKVTYPALPTAIQVHGLVQFPTFTSALLHDMECGVPIQYCNAVGVPEEGLEAAPVLLQVLQAHHLPGGAWQAPCGQQVKTTKYWTLESC